MSFQPILMNESEILDFPSKGEGGVEWMRLFFSDRTLPETNITVAPENRQGPKENDGIPTIYLQVRTVSFRECTHN